MRLSPSPLVALALTFAMGPPRAQAQAAAAPAPYDILVLRTSWSRCATACGSPPTSTFRRATGWWRAPAGDPGAHALQQGRGRGRPAEVLRAARLRRGGPGRARPLPFGRTLAPAARRRPGRLGPRRVDRPAAVVDGGIGTVGTSYAAAPSTRWLSPAPPPRRHGAGRRHERRGRYGIRHNGAFELRWLNWFFTLGNASGMSAGPAGFGGGPSGSSRSSAPRSRRGRAGSQTWAARCASS